MAMPWLARQLPGGYGADSHWVAQSFPPGRSSTTVPSFVDTAIDAGCERLYSEDLNDGQRFSGVTVVNPFRAGI
jgi:hypothetical protein